MRVRTLAILSAAVIVLAIWLLWPGSHDPDAAAADAGPAAGALARSEPTAGEAEAGPPEPDLSLGVAGIVEDDAGRSVPGARVRFVPDGSDSFLSGDEPEPRELLAGADGSFSIPELTEGRWVLLADHERHPIGGFAGPVAIPRSDPHPLVIALGSAAAIEGVVKDREGRGIAGASLTIGAGPGATESDGRGEFRVSAVDPRRPAAVRAEAQGFAPATQTIRPHAGEATHVELVLVAGRELAGRVVDDGRRPVARARVTVRDLPEARTDSDENGDFTFENLPADDLTLTAFHVEYASSAPVAVGPRDRSVVLVLRRPASIAGDVIGPDGDMLMGVRVSLVPTAGPAADENGSRSPRTALSNAEGAYSFQQVVEGTYSVLARSEGEAGRVDGVAVRSGDEKTGVDVRLGGRVTIVGRVITQFTNEPVAGASVEARFPPTSMVRVGEAPKVETDGRGRFRLDRVPSDVLGLRVVSAAHAPESFPVEIRPSPIDVGDLPLEPRQFGGVGMVLREDAGEIQVREVMEDLPAARAGLASGDVVIAIDGERIDGMALEDAVSRIRGTEGETVKLLVRRPGRPDPFELSIVRETVDTERDR